jgi:Zn-dependent membrane protease YugP
MIEAFAPMYFFYMDPYFLLLLLIAGALTGISRWLVSSTFKKYTQVPASTGKCGAEAAQAILHSNGIYDVTIEPVGGSLTDHYDPRGKVLRLSEPVYGGRSLSALGVAAHEAGHAIQHATGYPFLAVRSFIAPLCAWGSKLAMPLIIIGFILMRFAPMAGGLLFKIAVILFAFTVFFQLVTLPVEFNASSRAITQLHNAGLIYPQEEAGARKVLRAAALTYVAAAAVAIMQLLYMFFRYRR